MQLLSRSPFHLSHKLAELNLESSGKKTIVATVTLFFVTFTILNIFVELKLYYWNSDF